MQPIYLGFANVIWEALKAFDGVLPALEEIEFLRRINAPANATSGFPGGRLWQLLHPAP